MVAPAQYFQITAEPLPLDWPEGGNRLLSLAFEELSTADPSTTGWNSGWVNPTPEDPVAHHRLTVNGGLLTSQLCVLPLKAGGLHLAIRSEGPVSADQLTPWLDALQRALPRLNDDQPLHQWWAAIAANPGISNPQRLAAQAVIDGLELQPGTASYVEITEGHVPMLSGGNYSVCWPVVVVGETAGYSPAVATEAAARRLGILCAVLSVALDACWEIAQAVGPHPLDPSALPRSRVPAPGDDFGGFMEPDVAVLPAWVAEGLATAESTPDVLSALRAHHQAMMLEKKFPSFSFLAYTAAIEGIGARYVPLKPCPTCPNKTGAGKRFRAALALVLRPDEAKSLGALYDLRSTTAHEGRLHAGEELFGAFPGRMIPHAGPLNFRYGYLGALRRASRDLLTLALTDRLPHPEVQGVA